MPPVETGRKPTRLFPGPQAEQFVDIFNGSNLSGYFCVQDHGRKIEYRNIRLKEL